MCPRRAGRRMHSRRCRHRPDVQGVSSTRRPPAAGSSRRNGEQGTPVGGCLIEGDSMARGQTAVSATTIEAAFGLAVERYAELGVDVEAALAAVAAVPMSLHCWQG